MLFWISLMDKWSFCDEIEFLHVWTCQFDFFTLIAGCRSESKFKTQDHRPSNHFGWLEILRLNYEYFSYSPICEREKKSFMCVLILSSQHKWLLLYQYFSYHKVSCLLFSSYEFIRIESGSLHLLNCSTKDANMSEQFLDVKLWPPERKRIANEFLMKRNIGN